jgi:hypothetical protein
LVGRNFAGVIKQQIPRAVVPRFGMTILERVFIRTAPRITKNVENVALLGAVM